MSEYRSRGNTQVTTENTALDDCFVAANRGDMVPLLYVINNHEL